jgi:hypothetical protein
MCSVAGPSQRRSVGAQRCQASAAVSHCSRVVCLYFAGSKVVGVVMALLPEVSWCTSRPLRGEAAPGHPFGDESLARGAPGSPRRSPARAIWPRHGAHPARGGTRRPAAQAHRGHRTTAGRRSLLRSGDHRAAPLHQDAAPAHHPRRLRGDGVVMATPWGFHAALASGHDDPKASLSHLLCRL